MAIALRRNGRAATRYSDSELYDLVARVAVWVNRRQPTRVTQADFDLGRAGVGLSDLPSARAICMRLGQEGKSRPWADVLEVSCSEHLDRERHHGRQRSSGEQPHLGERHLYFALNVVAQHLGVRSLTPDDYDRGREEMAEAEARRRTGHLLQQPNLLTELLPNSTQIERIVAGQVNAEQADGAGDNATSEEIAEALVEAAGGRGRASGSALWDRALQMAGLEPRQSLAAERARTRRRRPGLPLAEAIHHFVEANGRWPSSTDLFEFGQRLDISIERHDRSVGWSAHLEQARNYRAELELESPGLPFRSRRSRETRPPILIPDGGIPGAPPRQKRGSGAVTEEDILEALQRFEAELPAAQSRTRAAYKRFAVENGLPSPTTIDRRFSGFKAMLAKARASRREGAVRN